MTPTALAQATVSRRYAGTHYSAAFDLDDLRAAAVLAVLCHPQAITRSAIATVALNAAVDELRRMRVLVGRARNQVREQAVALTEALDLPDTALSLEQRTLLWVLVGQLPPRQCRAVTLHAYGYSHPEIGERMGVGPAGVKSALRRGWGKLREWWGEDL